MTEQAIEQQTPAGPRRFGRDLTVGSIPRHLLAFSLPLLAGSLLQTSYVFVNAIWVGHYLGETAMAAVANSMQVVFGDCSIIIAVIRWRRGPDAMCGWW